MGRIVRVGWDNSRSDTNISGNTWKPRHQFVARVQLPAVAAARLFSIDNARQQLQVSLKNREIADVGLRQTLAATTRTVRNAYYNLAYAVASLAVATAVTRPGATSRSAIRVRASRSARSPPIDIVEAQSEVAARQEAVIVAQANIATAEDTLRALVFDPAMPDFWNMRIEPTELPAFQPTCRRGCGGAERARAADRS